MSPTQEIRPIQAHQLAELCRTHRYGRFLEDPQLPDDAGRRLFVNDLQMGLKNKTFEGICLKLDNQQLGALFYHLSSWDSEHFGFNVAIIDHIVVPESESSTDRHQVTARLLQEFQTWCQISRIRCVFVKVSALNLPVIHALERTGYGFIESWVHNKVVLQHATSAPTLEARRAHPEDLDLLLSWLPGAFVSQRFHADPNFERDKCEDVYTKWARSAFERSQADVLVFEHESRACAALFSSSLDLSAYFGLKLTDLSMAIVDPKQRARGIGKMMFESGFQYYREQGMDVVHSGLSTRNVASMRLHNRAQFTHLSTLVTFHKWLDVASTSGL
jgi:L-amino acid N-acyltransferase YncA